MGRLRELLIVANAFPPEPFAGTPRVAKTVKYLTRAGVSVRVLCPHPRASGADPSLLPDVAGAAEVVRVARIHPGPLAAVARWMADRAAGGFRATRRDAEIVRTDAHANGFAAAPAHIYNRLHALLFVPDETIGWLPFAWPAGRAMIRRRRPDMILSSGPGHACHLIAALLAREFALPFVAEFRDPWIGNPMRRPPTPWHARIEARMERFVLDAARGVVTIGEAMSDAYRARTAAPVETVRNAYDPEEFASLPFGGAPVSAESDGPLIAHAGTFYEGRSPAPFLAALARRRAATGRAPRVRFIGPGEEAIRAHAHAHGVADRIEITGPLPRAACLARLSEADALLLVPGPGAGTITGKVFEYLALGRPVLALASPEQEVARLLQDSRGGHEVAPPDDPAALDAALARILDAARAHPAPPDPRHGRPFQVFRLRRFLESLLP